VNRERWQRIQEIFFDTLDLPEADRSGFVRHCCADDSELASEVLAMLSSDDVKLTMIDRGLVAIAVDSLCASRLSVASMDFAPYRLLELLGEGGMGVVYLAEHTGNGKRVAIKILIDAKLSPARMERFAREQIMLAKLDHRYIAHLYHADVLADGTPWFAMEYVGSMASGGLPPEKALPLNEYCRLRQCTMDERLRLFRAVCEAVQYVHSQMLIHRDLKPSNILVTAEGMPKLIDFGIGKTLIEGASAGDQTITVLRMMTLACASPEQIRGAPALPACDIYALGAVLYELIAESHPFDLSNCTIAEAERMIVEGVLEKPSLVARSARNAPIATRSQWNDLDALCLKAMHKEAHRRYQTVEAMIDDLDNYLAARPLKARPDGFAYTASRFLLRNHRVVASVAFLVLFVVGLVVFYTIRLARARDEALAETARTERVERFMLDLFQNGDGEVGPAPEMNVSTLLENGVKEANAMNQDPAIQADLYQTLGDIYQSWGKFDTARSLLDASLQRRQSLYGTESAKAAVSLVHVGLWYGEQDRYAEAEQMIRQALSLQEHQLRPDDPEIGRTLTALGLQLQRRGKLDESLQVLDRAIKIQSERADLQGDLSDSLGLLANVHFYMGHYAISDSLNRKGLALDKLLHGDRHPNIAEDLINLGNVQMNLEHYREAESNFRQALDITQSWYGKQHINWADNATYLSQALVAEKKLDEAQALLREALAVLDRNGNKEPGSQVALVLDELGMIAQQQSNLKAAEDDFRRSADIYATVYGKDHRNTAKLLGNLATVYLEEREYARAEAQFEDALDRYSRISPADPLNVGIIRIKLGRTLRLEKRYREAESQLVEGRRIVLQQAGASNSWLQDSRPDVEEVHRALDMPDKISQVQASIGANRDGNK